MKKQEKYSQILDHFRNTEVITLGVESALSQISHECVSRNEKLLGNTLFPSKNHFGEMEPWVFPTAPGSKALLDRFIFVSWALARIILANLYKVK